MTQHLRGLSLCLFASLLAFATGLRAANASDYGMSAGSITFAAGATAPEVQRAILESAIGRGWNILSREDGKVVLALDQEKWSARLTLLYTAQDVQFFSNSTRSGKPKLPETWIKFLKQDIKAKIALLLLSKP